MSSSSKEAEFINNEFLQNALQNYTKDTKLKVINFTVTNATDKGDNYTSDMYRVTVEYLKNGNNASKSMIIKIAPRENGPRKEMVDEINAFPQEIIMMTDTLVKMNKMLRSLNEDVLSAEVYYTKLEAPSILVLEDLKSSGFRMGSRHTGFDLSHAELALKSLARFHASSLHFLDNEEYDMETYKNRFFCSTATDNCKEYIKQGIVALAKEIKNWPEVDASYSEKLEKLADVAFEKSCRVLNGEHHFKVINHGDNWVNNMMFRYDDNDKPIQQIFVDFQLCCYTSPAMDITNLFSTSLKEDLYQNQRDHLLNVYLETLGSVMRRLGSKRQVPLIGQLKDSLRKFAIYELVSTFTFRPIITSRKEEAQDINDIFDSEQMVNVNNLRNPAFKEIVINRLPAFDKLGLFD